MRGLFVVLKGKYSLEKRRPYLCFFLTESPCFGGEVHSEAHSEHIFLMVLPTIVSNGTKNLEVNVMLDPCSTGSYVTEVAAEELELHARPNSEFNSGTAGTEVKKLSCRVELSVACINGHFSAILHEGQCTRQHNW